MNDSFLTTMQHYATNRFFHHPKVTLHFIISVKYLQDL